MSGLLSSQQLTSALYWQPVSPVHLAVANGSTNTTPKALPACKESFPTAAIPISGMNVNGSFNFEKIKEEVSTDRTPRTRIGGSCHWLVVSRLLMALFLGVQNFYKHKVAELAPCLLVEGRCGESVHWVDAFAGALASVTQGIYDGTVHRRKLQTKPPREFTDSAPVPANTAHKQEARVRNFTDSAPAPVPANTVHLVANATNNSTGPAASNTTANSTATARANSTATTTPTTPPAANTTATNTTRVGNVTAPANATTPVNSTTPAALPKAGGNNTRAAAVAAHIANSTALHAVVNEYAQCVTSQPGGIDGFLQEYARAVQSLLSMPDPSTAPGL